MLTHSVRSFNGLAALLMTTTMLLVNPGATHAGPFDPTWRGDANSVHAIFDWVGPAGGPSTWTTTLFETGPSAFPLSGVVPEARDNGGGEFDFDLPNFIDPLPIKHLRVQLGFDGAVDSDDITALAVGHDPFPVNVIEIGRSLGVANWHYIDFDFLPNPDWERIDILGGAGGVFVGNLLRIEVDTVSVPEPATLALVGLGLAGIGLRRRKVKAKG